MIQKIWKLRNLTDNGERVTHLYPNDCYYAHLSIYRFAVQFCKNKIVLDAGCGAGYGTNYLAVNGVKSIVGIDLSAKAIAFCNKSFSAANLSYQHLGLEDVDTLPSASFDVVYCSNVLEHVVNTQEILRKFYGLLKSDGIAILAVPPVTSPEIRDADFSNPYHLNSWSPQQWVLAVNKFFKTVEPFGHYLDKDNYHLDFGNRPRNTRIDERNFKFESIEIEDFYRRPSLTAIFVASNPLDKTELPALDQQIAITDHSVTRGIAHNSQKKSWWKFW